MGTIARLPVLGRKREERGTDALAAALRARVRGEVRFDDGSRGLYATDASNYRQTPIGVVLPRDAADVEATVELCREHDVPVLGRGGGTSLAGQCCNTAVVLDFTKYMNRILEIDPERGIARVEPGVVLDQLRRATREHGLTFGPDPATHRWCTFGGMIGNNSCGVHSLQTGRTEDNVEALRVLLYDGTVLDVGPTDDDEFEAIMRSGGRRAEIYRDLKALAGQYAEQIRERFPPIPRRVSGYSLDALLPENGFHVARSLVGTESTCGIVLEATVRLVPRPAERALLVLGYPDIYDAADHVPEILAHEPIGLEGMDERLVEFMRHKGLHVSHLSLLPEGRGWLLAEFGGGDGAAAEAAANRAREALERHDGGPSMQVLSDPEEMERIWTIRESGLGATAFVPGMEPTWEGWEDAAVEPARLGDYLREFRGLLERYGYEGALYGHFGDGCVHTRTNFDLETENGIAQYMAFIEEAADLVIEHGGSLSGEHGDGQSRAALLPKMFGEELVDAFRGFKRIWDPENRMNPGKVVDGYRPDENLRLGPDYRPQPVETTFAFPEDENSFARATLRCVGVGKCRRTEKGIMCPSYQVTREEKHSTRGRAHLLFEMMSGDVVTDGWRSDAVREALDLCLACKACKSECPVNVDMATYKAEFLSHYYARRIRPRAAYSMGLIYWWARAASLAPRLVNVASTAPVLSPLLKWLGGIAPERSLPRFAERTFRQRYKAREETRPRINGAPGPAADTHAATGPADDADAGPAVGAEKAERPRVLLWPDTFTNHFDPAIGEAAVDVLEAAGFEVVIPDAQLCCGRPLYDWGMLDVARRLLRQTLEALRPELERDTPVLTLEPSCGSVLRDELPQLFPEDPAAQRLAERTYTFGEFVAKHNEWFDLPQLRRDVLVHGHCHHKSVLDFDADRGILRDVAASVEEPDTGCCGMAGAFGFNAEHYEVAQACGERVLLPAARAAESDRLLVTDGFSCRQQIQQNTGREALHLAQVLRLAYEEQGLIPAPAAAGRLPATAATMGGESGTTGTRLAIGVGALAVGALLVWSRTR